MDYLEQTYNNILPTIVFSRHKRLFLGCYSELSLNNNSLFTDSKNDFVPNISIVL